jgi:ligand-binding sensor domain-containing protein
VRVSRFLLRATFWAVLFGGTWAAPAVAAESPVRPAAVRFLHLTTEQGLSQDDVYCLLQDHQRFLWFGTGEGLSRYDGYSFQVFKSARGDATSLPSNWIWSLYEDRWHRLWVGSTEGLSLYDRATESFRTFRPPGATIGGVGSSTVTSILADRRGRLWVGTHGGGLNLVDPATGEFLANYRHSDVDSASLSHDHVMKILEDTQGRLWVGTAQGLNRFDPDKKTFVRYMHGDDPSSLGLDWVWDVAEDREGRLWVATFGGGLSVLDREGRKFRRYQKQGGRLPNDAMTNVFVDHEGTVWAGTDGSGLLRYDPATDEFASFGNRVRDSFSLSKNLVRALGEDVQGNLWIGTLKGGVNVLQRSARGFSLYSHDPSDPQSLSEGSAVNAILEDRHGRVWVAMSEGGLNRFDPERGTFVRYRSDPRNPRSLSADTLISLFEDSRGRLWIGTHGGGLDLFDPERGEFRRYRHGDGDSLGNDYVWSIAEDPGGGLWLGTNGGLDHFDVEKKQFTHYRPESGVAGSLADSAVRALLVEPSGDLWVGTLGGLDYLEHGAGEFSHLRNSPADPQSLSNNSVVTLRRDARGRLWIGTLGGGLDVLRDGKRFASFRTDDGLPSDSISCIAEDRHGQLWLGTNNGLARFQPDGKQVKNFGRSNGLRSLQFGLGSCARTRDGHLLFGSADGLYYFDPDRVKSDTNAPPVVFTALRLFGQPVHSDVSAILPSIRLAHWQNVLSVEFAALDFTMPRGNSYSYKLEGFREEWAPLGAKHELSFTNLDPGTYTLHVRATNSDGLWSEPGAALRIVVTPPFWATWWFRLSIVTAFAALLGTAYRLRIRQLERREGELTRRVDEALARVKVLRGLLPMCSWCKKVRDDTGYWNQIEAYLSERSEADFSHGICPDCALKVSPHM